MAQVYSANVVGYVNVTIPNGYSMIANPLDAGDNSVANLFAAASANTPGNTVYTWNGASLIPDTCDAFDGTWQNPSLDLAPGKGFFFQNGNGAPFTVTFVGTVKQGAITQPTIQNGYSVLASPVPVTGYLQTDLGLTNAQPGDTAYLWNGSSLIPCTKDAFDGTWQTLSAPFSADVNKGPQIAVGSSFFYQTASGPIPWNLNFTVQ
jgi:hypothetical protein